MSLFKGLFGGQPAQPNTGGVPYDQQQRQDYLLQQQKLQEAMAQQAMYQAQTRGVMEARVAFCGMPGCNQHTGRSKYCPDHVLDIVRQALGKDAVEQAERVVETRERLKHQDSKPVAEDTVAQVPPGGGQIPSQDIYSQMARKL